MINTYNDSLGSDEALYATWLALVKGLAGAMADQLQRDGAKTDDLDELGLGRLLPRITLEPVPVERIFHGYRPSLIASPAEQWPAVAVSIPTTAQSPVNANLDTGATQRSTISVEVIVKSDRVENSEEVNTPGGGPETQAGRRCVLMVEAISQVRAAMRDHPLGALAVSNNQPAASWGEIFTKSDLDGEGYRFYWQGARIQFAFDKVLTD